MTRDWDVIREILTRLESLTSTQEVLEPGSLLGFAPEHVSYQIALLIEAGLVEGNCSRSLNAPMHCYAFRLTWAGHEFLDQIRSETAWKRIKALLKEKGIDLSFDTIKVAAGTLIKQILGGS
jgi:hypothetical protein